MTIRKRTSSLLFATAATTAAVVGLCVAPALASSPLSAAKLTVKVSGGGKFTAIATKTVLTNRVHGTNINVTCTTKGRKHAASASGNIPSRTDRGTSPVKVGTATNLAFNNCIGPVGPVTTKVVREPYFVAVDSKTNRKGQTDGFIGGIDVNVKTFACSFTVTGSAPGFYTNGKHSLTMTPRLPVRATFGAQLTVSHVVGCAGLVNNRNHPTFSGVFALNRKGVIKSS
jgi:hypothetical protein